MRYKGSAQTDARCLLLEQVGARSLLGVSRLPQQRAQLNVIVERSRKGIGAQETVDEEQDARGCDAREQCAGLVNVLLQHSVLGSLARAAGCEGKGK